MRRKEILDAANEDLLAAVLQNMESWIGDGKIALVLFSIFQKCFGKISSVVVSYMIIYFLN